MNETRVSPLDAHDRELLRQVRPEGWRNPVPHRRYNLVVLGGGTAGLVAAVGAAGLGARVALVERALLGGDCLNTGCVPSKALIRAARAVHDARDAPRFGARIEGRIEPGFAAAMERLRRLRASIAPADSAARLASLGVHVFLGTARFVAGDAVDVDGTRLRFARAVVATGARSLVPPIPGLRELEPLTSETVFGLTEAPRRLLVLGAGPIGCELGQAFRRLGSEVRFVSLDPRVLPRDDPDAAALVHRALERDGCRLELGAKVVAAGRRGGSLFVAFERDGARGEAEGDALLVAIGRAPNTEELDLGRAGIEADRSGIRVDDRLRTTNPRVWASGDVATSFKFTHAADEMSRIVLANALFHGRRTRSTLVIPWCTYTDPEVAHVGIAPDEARKRGADTLTLPLAEVDRAVLEGDDEGFARVHLARGGDRILGATLVARHAGEMLGEVVLAMRKGLGLGAIAATIHAYPTTASAWKRLGDQRRRDALTPFVRGLLDRWLAWQRR